MEQIERETCIRFQKINPTPSTSDWLLFMREGDKNQQCLRQYLKDNLADKDINGLGKIFRLLSFEIKSFIRYIKFLFQASSTIILLIDASVEVM